MFDLKVGRLDLEPRRSCGKSSLTTLSDLVFTGALASFREGGGEGECNDLFGEDMKIGLQNRESTIASESEITNEVARQNRSEKAVEGQHRQSFRALLDRV